MSGDTENFWAQSKSAEYKVLSESYKIKMKLQNSVWNTWSDILFEIHINDLT